MLKFYGYYKQVTQGRCNEPKPSFWDLVGKAKWEAWNRCGDMSQTDAMKLYVEELKQVVSAHLKIVHWLENRMGLISFFIGNIIASIAS